MKGLLFKRPYIKSGLSWEKALSITASYFEYGEFNGEEATAKAWMI